MHFETNYNDMLRLTGILLTICIAFSCLTFHQNVTCDVANSDMMACPMSTISMPVLMSVAQHDAILPTTSVSIAVLAFALAFWSSGIPPKHINYAKWRYRRRFLHAILPRYGPQNQIGHLSFISPERAP